VGSNFKLARVGIRV